MNDTNIKLKKLNKIIQKYLSKIIHEKIYNLKNDIITITNVITSKDLSISKIFISTLKENYTIIKILNNASKHLRYNLSKKIKTHKIPKIKFLYDENLNQTIKLKNLLETIKK